MGTIQELPALERPREKGMQYGIDQLSDSELIAIIIGSGYHGANAREVANTLLEKYNGLVGLSRCPSQELTTFKGVKQIRALLISVVFELHRRIVAKENELCKVLVDCDYLYKHYYPVFSNEKQEYLALVIVNRTNHILFEKILYKGTENNVVYSYKDIWRELLVHQAHAFYLVHNHPNNKAEPSMKDIIFTEEISKEAMNIKVPLRDHIIIGDDGYYSFKNTKKYQISC